MNKFIFHILLFFAIIVSGCQNNKTANRIPIAEVNKKILYYDQIPQMVMRDLQGPDSLAMVQNYINRWAKHELLLMRAEANLSQEARDEIAGQLEETRANLLIYHYQRQMMYEKMDTIITDVELENYYAKNETSFSLTSNIVKALFIKLPASTPNISRIKSLVGSTDQNAMQQLESLCYNYAERFDDFNENWISLGRLFAELPTEISVNEESFLRRNYFYETSDPSSIYMISIRDFRRRSTTSPYEYVKDDIRRIIMISRRFDFIQSLENTIYNDAIKENYFNIY